MFAVPLEGKAFVAGTKSDGGAVGGSGAKMKRRVRRRVVRARVPTPRYLRFLRPKWLRDDEARELTTRHFVLSAFSPLQFVGNFSGEKLPAAGDVARTSGQRGTRGSTIENSSMKRSKPNHERNYARTLLRMERIAVFLVSRTVSEIRHRDANLRNTGNAYTRKATGRAERIAITPSKYLNSSGL